MRSLGTQRIVGIALIYAVLMLAMVGTVTANPRYDAWQEKHPFTQTSAGQHEIGGNRIMLDEFKGSGLNTAMDGRWFYSQGHPVPETYGLPTIYTAYTPSGMKYFLQYWDEARIKHKNMVGVLLGDELAGHPADELKSIREVRDWIANNPDPAVSSLVVIDSEASGDTVSANPGVQSAWTTQVATTKPDVWLAQFYPVSAGVVRPSYYSSLEWYFNWAKEKDVAMWCWLTAWSSSAQTIPCDSELRLQRFTSLAYGMRGFSDFLWTADGTGPSVKGAGYWDGSGKPTKIYTQLQVINKEIANIAKSLIRLTPIRAYHMDGRDDGDGVHHWSDSDAKMPAWTRRTGRLANVTGAVNGNHLLVGFFRDKAGEEYFMVVNKDIAKDTDGSKLVTPVTLTFHPSVKSIERLSRETGKVETIPVKDNYTFSLYGGTGDLFKFSTGAGFAGVDKPAVAKMVSMQPASGSICGVANNRIVLKFASIAREVIPEIRIIGQDGKPAGGNLGERFERILSADGKTLSLKEKGAVLANRASFQLTLHYADAPLVIFSKLAGDINADGKLSAEDATAFDKALAAKDLRADIDGDGQVLKSDGAILDRLINTKPFEWKESFDSYPVGPLAGNGLWAEAEGLPGSLLMKAWIYRTALVAPKGDPAKPDKAAGGGTAIPSDFIGNEARFTKDGGLGEFGIIRWEFTTRSGPAGFQNNGAHIWNSQDKEGVCGSLAVEEDRGSLTLGCGRGVTLERQTWPLPIGSGHAGDPFRVSVVANCDSRTITLSCTNLTTSDTIGPFEVPYTGTLKGIDATSLFLNGEGGYIDDIVIKNY